MNFKLPTTNYQLSTGFTLIETLVAISILTVAVAGPMVTASRAIVAAQNASDQLTASYLAQEGIEYARALRDNEFLVVHTQPLASDTAWTNFLAEASLGKCVTSDIGTPTPPFCTYDPGDGGSLTLCAGACTPLNLVDNGSTNVYTQNPGGTATSFTRTIQAIPAGEDEEIIVSKVSWEFHDTEYSVVITEHLTPWQ